MEDKRYDPYTGYEIKDEDQRQEDTYSQDQHPKSWLHDPNLSACQLLYHPSYHAP